MKITNTQPGPRGINTVSGPVLVEPGETVDVKVFSREREHIEAAGWFTVEGDYTDDASLRASDDSNEIDELKKQLAERDAEIAKLKAGGGGHDRDELKKQATELGLDFPPNVKTEKLKELIDAKLAE